MLTYNAFPIVNGLIPNIVFIKKFIYKASNDIKIQRDKAVK